MSARLNRLWATKTREDEWWSSFVTSPLAILANLVVVDVKWLTPNRITLASFVVAVLSVLFILKGGAVPFMIAAALIQLSHVLDCMDGQMARYRGISSPVGGYYDKVTDQIQVTLWFGAVAYAAFAQTGEVLPVFLAAAGITFYNLRGYTKYVAIHAEMTRNSGYLAALAKSEVPPETAGLGFGAAANFRWLLREQAKILHFDEGVFVFMLSAALLLDALNPMLWVFAASQLVLGLLRAAQNSLSSVTNLHPEK